MRYLVKLLLCGFILTGGLALAASHEPHAPVDPHILDIAKQQAASFPNRHVQLGWVYNVGADTWGHQLVELASEHLPLSPCEKPHHWIILNFPASGYTPDSMTRSVMLAQLNEQAILFHSLGCSAEGANIAWTAAALGLLPPHDH